VLFAFVQYPEKPKPAVGRDVWSFCRFHLASSRRARNSSVGAPPTEVARARDGRGGEEAREAQGSEGAGRGARARAGPEVARVAISRGKNEGFAQEKDREGREAPPRDAETTT
jgi:hypothetical protein